MRILIATCLLLISGCKTLELAVTHPTTGVHIVARVDAQSPAAPDAMTVLKRLPAPNE